VRGEDQAGAELSRWKAGELEELSPIEVTLPAEGTYYLHVGDMQRHGSSAHAYRLRGRRSVDHLSCVTSASSAVARPFKIASRRARS